MSKVIVEDDARDYILKKTTDITVRMANMGGG